MLTQAQREEYLPKADSVLDRVGYYSAYQLDESEFVGTTPYAIPGPKWYLTEKAGYEYNGLAALKYHWDDETKHDTGSYRKVDQDNPRYQYHVHLFLMGTDPTEPTFHVASHYEMRPDLRPIADENLLEMYSRLRTHYRPEYGSEYVQGKACEKVEELISSTQ